MKQLRVLCLIVSVLAVSASAQAHFIWFLFDRQGTQVRLELSESPGDSLVPMLGKLMPTMNSQFIGPMTEDADHKHLTTNLISPEKAGGVSVVYGVFEGRWVRWSAKGSANIAAAGQKLNLPVDITVRRTNSELVALVTRGGKPVAGAEFVAVLPGHKEPTPFKVSAQGEVRLPNIKEGILALRAVIHEPTSGEYKGLHYMEKLDCGTLTIKLSN